MRLTTKSVALMWAAVLFVACQPSAAQGAGTVLVAIDAEQSSIKWTGRKLTGSHYGIVRLKQGQAQITGGKLSGGRFEVDLRSIEVQDIEDPKTNKRLADHLRSDDFFSIAQHPVAEFVISAVQPAARAAKGEHNYTISGNLTIKGITRPVEFPALVQISGGQALARAKFSLDRTAWDIHYGSGRFFKGLGDKLIYDEFDVELSLVGTYPVAGEDALEAAAFNGRTMLERKETLVRVKDGQLVKEQT